MIQGRSIKAYWLQPLLSLRDCKKFILAESRVDGKDYDGVLGWVE